MKGNIRQTIPIKASKTIIFFFSQIKKKAKKKKKKQLVFSLYKTQFISN